MLELSHIGGQMAENEQLKKVGTGFKTFQKDQNFIQKGVDKVKSIFDEEPPTPSPDPSPIKRRLEISKP